MSRVNTIALRFAALATAALAGATAGGAGGYSMGRHSVAGQAGAPAQAASGAAVTLALAAPKSASVTAVEAPASAPAPPKAELRSGDASRWPPPPRPGSGVFPQEAKSLATIALPDLVFTAMAPKGFGYVYWDHMAEAPIVWRTNGYTALEGGTGRVGLARVRSNGRAASVLRQTREELAWTVTLGTDGPEKFGPRTVSMTPGVEEALCFGTRYEGCDFPVGAALSGRVHAARVCREGAGENYSEVYWLTASGKQPAQMKYSLSCGSGGCSSWIDIDPFPARRACAFGK